MTNKKGVIVFRKNGEEKVHYCHRNSQLRSLGRKVVKMSRQYGLEELSKLYDSLILVNEDEPMTPEQREAYKKYMPEQAWSDSITWTDALRYTKDAIEPLLDGFPYVVDYSTFIEGWRNRWQYYIDLDDKTLKIYKGGLEILCQQSEDFFDDEVDYPGRINRVLLGTFPLEHIPDNWLEIIEDRYAHHMQITVSDLYK